MEHSNSRYRKKIADKIVTMDFQANQEQIAGSTGPSILHTVRLESGQIRHKQVIGFVVYKANIPLA